MFKEFLKYFKNKRGLLKQAQLKEDVSLYPHQTRAVGRIVDKPNTILAHSVGSGKTLTSIAGFEELKKRGKSKKALVVVPASLRDNYGIDGVERFTDSTFNIIGNKQETASKHSPYGAPNPNVDYNIVSYELFRSNPKKYITETGADTVIFDELHRGKNITKTYKSIRDSRNLYKNFIGGTGSVVSNTITDVIPLIDAATGGKETLVSRKNMNDFRDSFFVRDNSPMYRKTPVSRKPIIALKNKSSLKKFLDDYVDYVDYEDVKDIARMPDKRISEKRVPLSNEQVKAYKKLLAEDRKLYDLIKRRRYEYLNDTELATSFNHLTEARKLVNDVGTFMPGESVTDTVEQTPKTKALLDDIVRHLEETPDGRAVLTSFLIKGGTETLEAGLKNRGIEYGKFIGKGNEGVTEESRQMDVSKFNRGDIRALILSGAGGEGLSLNDTTKIGVLDLHFNPEKVKQMEARGIRSGGLSKRPPDKRYVEVDRYISTMPKKEFLGLKWKDRLLTPDEVIYNIERKKEVQNDLIHDVMKDMMRDRYKIKRGSLEKKASLAALLGAGAAAHLAPNVALKLLKNTNRGRKILSGMLGAGVEHGYSGKKLSPNIRRVFEYGAGPETMVDYHLGTKVGNYLKTNNLDMASGSIRSAYEKLYESSGMDMVSGLPKNLIKSTLDEGAKVPILGSLLNFAKGEHSKGTMKFFSKLPTVPYDHKESLLSKGLGIGTAAAGAALSPHAIAPALMVNTARKLSAKTPFGKKFLKQQFSRGVEGKKLNRVVQEIGELTVSPGMFDTYKVGNFAGQKIPPLYKKELLPDILGK